MMVLEELKEKQPKLYEIIKDYIEDEGFSISKLCSCEDPDPDVFMVIGEITLSFPYCCKCRKLLTDKIEIH